MENAQAIDHSFWISELWQMRGVAYFKKDGQGASFSQPRPDRFYNYFPEPIK
jgi:hypothetical protein